MKNKSDVNSVLCVPEIDTGSAIQERPLAQKMIDAARLFRVDDAASSQMAVDLRNECAKKAADWEAQRLRITKPLLEAKRCVDEMFGAPVRLYKEAADYFGRAALAWVQEENRKRLEREQQLRAQEEERARRERERLAAQAQRMEEKGRIEKAETLKQQAENVRAMPVSAAEVATPTGVKIITRWRAEVIDKMELIKAVADGRASAEMLSVDMPALTRIAVATKGSFTMPGVRFFSEQGMASRG